MHIILLLAERTHIFLLYINVYVCMYVCMYIYIYYTCIIPIHISNTTKSLEVAPPFCSHFGFWFSLSTTTRKNNLRRRTIATRGIVIPTNIPETRWCAPSFKRPSWVVLDVFFFHLFNEDFWQIWDVNSDLYIYIYTHTNRSNIYSNTLWYHIISRWDENLG